MSRDSTGFLWAPDQTTGAYPPSWYAATANAHEPFPQLEEDISTDVCIIGGGYTGLSAALELADAGMNVVLLEAHRVGWGASGRNGGQVGTGLNQDQASLEKTLGKDNARHVWDITQSAKTLIHDRIARYGIACDPKPGVLSTHYHPGYKIQNGEEDWPGSGEYAKRADHMSEHYGYEDYELIPPSDMRDRLGSPAYSGGLMDWGAGHLHPLNLALGTAEAARDAGAQIFELSPVISYKEGDKIQVLTETHTVTADTLILGCNGYLDALEPRIGRRVLPINNFIAATEPFDEATARALIRDDVAVADSKFVINYFRLSSDRRMLFGGGENYSYAFPKDIAAFVRKPMSQIFPQLADVRIDYAWGGTLAITTSRLPHFKRLAPNVWSASGYSGNGVALANMAGKILADAVRGTMGQFDVMAQLPTMAFPGGAWLRQPLLVLAMTWYAMRDRLGI